MQVCKVQKVQKDPFLCTLIGQSKNGQDLGQFSGNGLAFEICTSQGMEKKHKPFTVLKSSKKTDYKTQNSLPLVLFLKFYRKIILDCKEEIFIQTILFW